MRLAEAGSPDPSIQINDSAITGRTSGSLEVASIDRSAEVQVYKSSRELFQVSLQLDGQALGADESRVERVRAGR